MVAAGSFLADLNGGPDGFLIDKLRFFGPGGPGQPEAVRKARTAEPVKSSAVDASMAYCMVLVKRIVLEPGASTTLHYAYGGIPPHQTLDFLKDYGQISVKLNSNSWKQRLVDFDNGQDDALRREMAWHSYYLLSATLYHSYYGTHRVPQGSAYLYLHGADGVARDLALSVLTLSYLQPKLARETLRQIMMLRDAANGQLTYAFGGYGVHSDALGLHNHPSDVDIFFLMALHEYVAATGDLGFFAEEVDFYPRHNWHTLPPGAQGHSVLDHVRAAVTHLFDALGTGDHGLLRIGSGDWSDAIVVESGLVDGPDGYAVENSKDRGESIPNTQMALYVLPRIANLVEPFDSDLAMRLRTPLSDLKQSVMNYWDGKWFSRAILRDVWDNPVILGEELMDLEAQVWPLIAMLLETDQEASLIQSIRRHADDRSSIGATLVTGGVWPAISQLLTWGYSRHHPDLAWESLKKNTLATRAEAFPNIWHNIWSGPDGIDYRSGHSWASPVTPVTDFPVMNANVHSMALFALTRLCGLEATAEGLIIAPRIPVEQFTLDMPLISLQKQGKRLSGVYHACVDGSRALFIAKPPDSAWVSAGVGEQYLDAIDLDAPQIPARY